MPEYCTEIQIREAWENIREVWENPRGELETAILDVYHMPNVGEDDESVRVILECMFQSVSEPYTAADIRSYGERLGPVYQSLTEIADEWLDDQYGPGITSIQSHIDREGVGRALVNDQTDHYYEYAGSYYYFEEEDFTVAVTFDDEFEPGNHSSEQAEINEAVARIEAGDWAAYRITILRDGQPTGTALGNVVADAGYDNLYHDVERIGNEYLRDLARELLDNCRQGGV